MTTLDLLHGFEKSQGKTFFGTCLICCFLGSWIYSLLSPFIIYILWFYKYNYSLYGFLLLISCAYLPGIGPWLRPLFRKHCMRHFSEMSVSIEGKKEDLLKEKTFLAVHPHGIFSFGWSTLLVSKELDHINWCFSSVLYWSPVFRLFARLVAGRPAAASPKMMKSLMKKGECLGIYSSILIFFFSIS